MIGMELIIAAAVFGLLIGSFLNVLIVRLRTGMSMAGRSRCFSCGTRLRWYDLVPVLSFLVLKGRCRSCGSSISWRYPAVELGNSALWALAALSLPASPVLLAFTCMFWSVLLAISVYDGRHKIIPDELTASASFLALGASYAQGGAVSLLTGLSAGLAFSGFLLLIWHVTRGKGMGFGDVKLAIPLGIFLGPGKAFVAASLAFFIGAAVALVIVGIRRLSGRGPAVTMKSEIPFGPFMAIGALLAHFIDPVTYFSLFALWP
jgi:leader peptidase (prepilin peptidase) / N-methyltransferase